MKMTYHKPVLLKKSIDELVLNPNGIYVDATFGGGGHSREIIKKLSSKGRLFAFDQDLDAHQNSIGDDRFKLILSNFKYLKNQLRFLGISKIDGLLADLGVSSHQFDTEERGFSTRFEGNLDMRMNQKQSVNAEIIINELDEKDLANIFKKYGEIRPAFRWARAIVNARKSKRIKTTEDLKQILKKEIPEYKRNKEFAQLFQAIRIEVNDEISALKEMLIQSEEVIKPNGRLVVISYHSLEDRPVKRFIRNGMFQGEPEKDIYGKWNAPFRPLQAKVITANDKEIEGNPRARSAKLRVGIRNNGKKE